MDGTGRAYDRADGVRVLVTGSTSGLGAAMAAALLEAGAVVAVTGREHSRARSVGGELGAAHRARAGAFRLMSAKRAASTAPSAAAFGTLSGVDVLVNNTGIGMRTVNP